MIVMVIGTYICLFLFEDLPVSLILCGLIAQVTEVLVNLIMDSLFSGRSPRAPVQLPLLLRVKSGLRYGRSHGPR